MVYPSPGACWESIRSIETGASLLNGDQFEVFYAQTARSLRSYICRVSGSSAHADDILQEAYVRMLSAPPMTEAGRKSYLYRTATNLIVDQHRANDRRRRWWQLLPRRAESAASTVELSSDMERLFAMLAYRERALLWLAYVEGNDHREIATILGVTEGSVKVLLLRARRKMESILKKYGFEAAYD
jgi:RNA polymerase sigma-70 factor (ECF subfamily)